jgi:hypothetical protein
LLNFLGDSRTIFQKRKSGYALHDLDDCPNALYPGQTMGINWLAFLKNSLIYYGILASKRLASSTISLIGSWSRVTKTPIYCRHGLQLIGVRDKRLPIPVPLIRFHLVDAVVYAAWQVEQGSDLAGSSLVVPGAGTAISKEFAWNYQTGARGEDWWSGYGGASLITSLLILGKSCCRMGVTTGGGRDNVQCDQRV